MASSKEPVVCQLPAFEQGVCFPRPQRAGGRFPRSHSAQAGPALSCLTASLHCRTNSFGSSNETELLEIMLKPADGSCASFLGVSPPVRSGCAGGAANPWSHDRSWKQSAYSASSTNLQALRELDSEGESFLRAKDSSAARLVLAGTTEPPPADPADCSDAGSDVAAVNACAPFTCHTEYFLG